MGQDEHTIWGFGNAAFVFVRCVIIHYRFTWLVRSTEYYKTS